MLSAPLKLALVAGPLLAGTTSVAAQQPAALSAASDTTQPANPHYYHPVGRIGTANGQVLDVFIVGLNMEGKGLLFTRRHPLRSPRPQPVFLASNQLRWLRINGHYYEPIRRAGQPANGPALRVQAGPRVALFEVPTLKNERVPKKIYQHWGPPNGLLPAYFYWAEPFGDTFTHAYYLRRAGDADMTAVPAGPEFNAFLADYLADAPALAAAIRAGDAGHHYADVLALLTRYNALPAASGPAR